MTPNQKKQNSWNNWNKEQKAIVFTAEQTITWLEGMRELLFEVWRNDQKKLKKWHSDTQNLRLKFKQQL